MNIPFQPHALGRPVPDSPHAVCVSIPTVADVIGYEEQRPETIQQIPQGYPRFVRPPLVRRAGDVLVAERHTDRTELLGYPVAGRRAADELCAFVGAGEVERDERVPWLVTIPNDALLAKRAKQFLQHTGTSISTREAESLLLERGVIAEPFAEERWDSTTGGAAETFVRSELGQVCGARAEELFLTRSGMCGLYRSVQAVNEIARARRRSVWLVLGWLYIDSQRLFEALLPPGFSAITIVDVADQAAIEAAFQQYGARLAGVLTETPTNPLMRSADVGYLAQRARDCGAPLLIDPSTVGPLNNALLPFADLLSYSLTKYAAHTADVMAGLVVLNPASPWREQIAAWLSANLEPIGAGDLARLAWCMRSWREVNAAINATTPRVADYLRAHRAVRRVFWAEQETVCCEAVTGPGAVISFELDEGIERFFDAARFVKGPSFGAGFTIVCPYIMLAHYDLAGTAEGRTQLRSLGIDPYLLRISCGTEPLEEIVAEFGAHL